MLCQRPTTTAIDDNVCSRWAEEDGEEEEVEEEEEEEVNYRMFESVDGFKFGGEKAQKCTCERRSECERGSDAFGCAAFVAAFPIAQWHAHLTRTAAAAAAAGADVNWLAARPPPQPPPPPTDTPARTCVIRLAAATSRTHPVLSKSGTPSR
ncbi:hypothetical protein RB195_011960 [Necator americanus]|uniref:Uncharacterized protein n=1 Tax=Necator americanus TaxID=51031 RepID=A0ABR1D4U0_NECAM